MSIHDDSPAIQVQNLTSRYGAFTAVSDVSLQVQRGEMFALLGTNGAGKTTTLETLEGYRSPTSGSVTVLGGSPTDRRQIRPKMGIMLQESGLAAELTALETVHLGGAISGRHDDDRRMLDLVGLGGKSATKVAQLSGGEKRRLDFALAAYGTPELLFLDEPTTGLDPEARDALWLVVDSLRDSGSTVILTTHYQEEAQEHADRIALMHAGRIEMAGTVNELVADRPSRISFVPPTAFDQVPLSITGTNGELAVIETFQLQADLTRLLSWAQASGHQLDRLTATTSTLDDVFRSLGHSSAGLTPAAPSSVSSSQE